MTDGKRFRAKCERSSAKFCKGVLYMIPFYEQKKECISIVHKKSKHFPPHIHEAMECVYVTSGTLELGIGQELFHMEKGDFAIIFPNMIHHYQVFSEETSKAYYLIPSLSLSGQFQEQMQKYCPKNPVIKEEDVHPEIPNIIRSLYKEKGENRIVASAYMQLLLARSLPYFELVDKKSFAIEDIVYQTVSYIAENFKEEITLDTMAKDLGVSKYKLSRVFSSTFHKNFNQYVNDQRLNYVISMLENTNQSITEICLEAGFQSQRTFNRAFQEVYNMTPREYRKRAD